MKVLVSPEGSFMYVTNEIGVTIVPERPVLVKLDEFIRTLKMQKKINHLGGDSLPDEATDAEWKKWFEDAGGWPRVDVAVSSFIDKWEGLDEKSLAEQAAQTNARLEQEAREKAEADNLAAQQQLLAEAEAKAQREAETAKALADAEKLAEEKRTAQVKIDADAKKEAEEKAAADAKAKAEKKDGK